MSLPVGSPLQPYSRPFAVALFEYLREHQRFSGTLGDLRSALGPQVSESFADLLDGDVAELLNETRFSVVRLGYSFKPARFVADSTVAIYPSNGKGADRRHESPYNWRRKQTRHSRR